MCTKDYLCTYLVLLAIGTLARALTLHVVAECYHAQGKSYDEKIGIDPADLLSFIGQQAQEGQVSLIHDILSYVISLIY